jgi:hypothetical protein
MVNVFLSWFLPRIMLKWPPIPRQSGHLFRSYGGAEPLYKDILQLGEKLLSKKHTDILHPFAI